MHDKIFLGHSLPTIETDFIEDVITVTLPCHESGYTLFEVMIPVIDDETVERTELFLVYIEIVNAMDTSSILLGRNTIKLSIFDDDSKQTDFDIIIIIIIYIYKYMTSLCQADHYKIQGEGDEQTCAYN